MRKVKACLAFTAMFILPSNSDPDPAGPECHQHEAGSQKVCPPDDARHLEMEIVRFYFSAKQKTFLV